MLLITPAAAQESFPTSGLVHNLSEMSSIYFSCMRSSVDVVECDFIQTAVRRKAKVEERAKFLSESLAQYRDTKDKDSLQKDCSTFRQLAAEWNKDTSKQPPEVQERLKAMSQKERQEGTKVINSMVAFCDAPTEDNFLKFVTIGRSKDERTCRVYSHSYKQTLKRVPGSQVWTANEGPHGPCGLINVSRLEKAKDSKYFFTYLSKKIVTNRQANLLGDMKCTDLDETEYLHDWKSKSWDAGCEFIEFGP